MAKKTTPRRDRPLMVGRGRTRRAIWKGSLSFGLVNLPVELHRAVRDRRPRLRLLHRTDHSIVTYDRICQKEGKPVVWQDVVKGFEYEKGRFVVVTKEDFTAAALERTRRIDILDFVDGSEIDQRFFDVPYYLTTAEGSERTYAVLREALRKTGKVGIGRVMLREVQHLAALAPVDDALVLTLLRFGDELVEPSEIDLPEAKIDPRELKLAELIIDRLTNSWDPSRYPDEYRDNLMRVIRAKLKGRPPRLVTPAESRSEELTNLMGRLRASLAQAEGREKRKRRLTAAA